MMLIDQVVTGRTTVTLRKIHFWRTVLTAIAGLLFGLGWLAGKAAVGLWLAASWCAAAVKVGWRDSRTVTRT